MLDYFSFSMSDAGTQSKDLGKVLERFRLAKSANGGSITILGTELLKEFGTSIALLKPIDLKDFEFIYAGSTIPGANDGLMKRRTSELKPWYTDLYRSGAIRALETDLPVFVTHITGPRAHIHSFDCMFLPLEGAGHVSVILAMCCPTQHKNDLYREFLETFNEGMIAAFFPPAGQAETEPVIIAANPAAARLVGADGPHALIKTPLLQLFRNSNCQGPWESCLEVFKTKQPKDFELHVVCPSQTLWVKADIHPIKAGLLILLTDVSKFKKAVLELEHQHFRLTEEIQQREKLERELWGLAHLDALTGLPNRRAFKTTAVQKLAQAQLELVPCALLMLDIDHFKRINDSFGHPAGDDVLVAVAETIQASIRQGKDYCARIGGEEFVVLLYGMTAGQSLQVAEKLRLAIANLKVRASGEFITPTTSIGVVGNSATAELDTLISKADAALYAAKQQGRNRVVSVEQIEKLKAKKAA